MSPQDAPTRRSESGKGLLVMGLGLFLFSAVDTGAKFLTSELHPLQIVWTRQLGLLVGAVFLLLRYGLPILQTKHPKLQLLRGSMAVLSASLFIFALAYVPLADAVAISFVAPFIVTLLGALILREPVGIRRWVAVTLGFLGVLIVIRPGLGVVHPAAGLVILAALFFAIRQIISRALSDTDRTSTTVIYTALVSTVLLTVPLPFVWQTPTTEQAFILVLIAVLAAAAEICVIKALELTLAVVVAPMHYTLILWGTFYGWLVFGQLPDVWTWVGTALIVATGIYSLRREYLESKLSKA
ncbi:DMT family transporter [Ruegeria sp. 2205SS24-7]|uniref:DMT family transporter n=1 Tax=Ruegeria discodermiae TaxID=3064389 RepID=UPI0027413642|nr:DMT family transporter [Ruegeria sp. 2205SS24-7]MDP5221077.1 DMT family transporter [Ruegeria sp. 2205SS24-7]